MDQTEYAFNAVPAGQFATPLDKIMEGLRAKAQAVSNQPQISEGLASASNLLIPIADVQSAIEGAFELGRRGPVNISIQPRGSYLRL